MLASTGTMVTKRKNKNPSYGNVHVCKDETLVGVVLNRNYGFGFNHKATRFGVDTYNDNPCEETFKGPHPFSENETKAVRDFVFDHVNQLRFVYNFHSFGNMYLYPFNALKSEHLNELYPQYKNLFEEIASLTPQGDEVGHSIEFLDYTATGEASDWILAATGIPAVSPEIGSIDPDTR